MDIAIVVGTALALAAGIFLAARPSQGKKDRD